MTRSADELTFRAPHVRDAVELAARLRAGDRAELAAGGYDDPLAAVLLSVRQSTHCWAALGAGRVLCAFGVTPWAGAPGVGVPWFLATDGADGHRRSLTALPAAYIARMLEAYPRLVNFVHADNVRAIRWLQHLGFTIDAPAPFGPRGALFRRFEMTR